MTQKGDESQSGTIEMNETLKARGTPFKPEEELRYFIKTRKKRLSTEEIINYINWA